MTPCGALRASSPSSITVTTSSIWSWILLFHLFFALAAVTHFAPTRFYKQTTLRTEAFTQSSFCAQTTYTERFVHKKNFCTQTPLHTGFYERRKYLHTDDDLYKDAFASIIQAHRRFYTQYTQNLFTEKPLHRTIFTHVFSTHKKMTQRNLYTQPAHRSFYKPTFLHAETLPRAVFTQQKVFRTSLYAQKMHSCFYRQTVLTHRKFSAQKS